MTEPEVIRMIPLEEISPSALNPRSEVGDVAELAASISTLGIIQPLTVRPGDNGRYLLVAGERRFAAALAAGLTEVPRHRPGAGRQGRPTSPWWRTAGAAT